MNSAGKVAALILLTAFVTGCRHKTKATPPPAAQAPVLPVSQSAKNMPPPKLPPPELPKVEHPAPATKTPPPKPHKPAHHKVKHTEVPAEPAPAKNQGTEVAANGAGNDITPIGQITEAGGSTDTPRRNQILDEINSTEKGLNDIKRPLSAEEQTTATQIRTFLTKAKDALNQEDLDAAQTLVTKAKVLLDELTKP